MDLKTVSLKRLKCKSVFLFLGHKTPQKESKTDLLPNNVISVKKLCRADDILQKFNENEWAFWGNGQRHVWTLALRHGSHFVGVDLFGFFRVLMFEVCHCSNSEGSWLSGLQRVESMCCVVHVSATRHFSPFINCSQNITSWVKLYRGLLWGAKTDFVAMYYR